MHGRAHAHVQGTARMESSRRQRHPGGVPLPRLTRSLAPMPYDSKKPTITARAKIHVYCGQTGWAGGVERVSRRRSTFDAAAAAAAASRTCSIAAGVWPLLHHPAGCSGGWQGRCLHQAAAGAAGRRACTRAARPPQRRLEGGSHQWGGGAPRAVRPAAPTHRAEHHGAPVSSTGGRGAASKAGGRAAVVGGTATRAGQALQGSEWLVGNGCGTVGRITFIGKESCSPGGCCFAAYTEIKKHHVHPPRGPLYKTHRARGGPGPLWPPTRPPPSPPPPAAATSPFASTNAACRPWFEGLTTPLFGNPKSWWQEQLAQAAFQGSPLTHRLRPSGTAAAAAGSVERPLRECGFAQALTRLPPKTAVHAHPGSSAASCVLRCAAAAVGWLRDPTQLNPPTGQDRVPPSSLSHIKIKMAPLHSRRRDKGAGASWPAAPLPSAVAGMHWPVAFEISSLIGFKA